MQPPIATTYTLPCGHPEALHDYRNGKGCQAITNFSQNEKGLWEYTVCGLYIPLYP